MKKLTAILLCVIMVISCFSTAVYAETAEDVTVSQKFCDAVNQYVIDCGKGDLFGVMLDENGVNTYPEKLTPENIHIWDDEEYSENACTREFELLYYNEETEVAIFRIGELVAGGRPFIVVGDYTFSGIEYHKERVGIGYCYYEKGAVYSFVEAYDEKLVTDTELVEYVSVNGYKPVYTPCYEEDKIRFAEFRDCPIEDFDMHNEFYPYGVVDGYRMYFGWNYKSSYVEVEKRMGDYIFSASTTCYPSAFSLYLISDEEIITLEDAYDSGKIKDIDTVAYMVMHNVWIGVCVTKAENDDDIIDDPVGPYITIASDRIKSGEKVKLLAVENAENEKITFTSKTPEIAKVNQKGVVTALQKGMAEFEITVGDKKLTAKVNVTNNPKLEQKKVKVAKKGTVKVAIKGKVKNIKNVYNNTKFAKIKSKPNASTLKVKGLKIGKTTLEIKVNGVKTLKLKVVVK